MKRIKVEKDTRAGVMDSESEATTAQDDAPQPHQRGQRRNNELHQRVLTLREYPLSDLERAVVNMLLKSTRPPRQQAVAPKLIRPRCGAKCRDGHACQAPVFKRPDGTLAKRCRMHGGASTGPISDEGKRKSHQARDAGHRRWLESRRSAQA